jgi:hypothetical protein
MDQQWFEMSDIRHRNFNKSVWIPLRALQTNANGENGYLGYIEEFFGSASLAVPVDQKNATQGLELTNINYSNAGYYQDGKYTPSDVHQGYEGELIGVHLVLDQRGNRDELPEWHLHQDFVTTLGLKREGNSWISPDEGYIQVARLLKDKTGKPTLLEVRAEHLKDYLCARNMGLYMASYYSRDVVVEDASFISWKNGSHSEENINERWEGRILEIHEGGFPFGEKMAVFHIARTDVDEADDIPDLSEKPSDKNTKSSSWERGFEGRKLFTVIGELWRNDWIEPANISPRVKGDKSQPTIFYIVNEKGEKEDSNALAHSGKWLWFKPDVIMALAHRRGGGITWHTRNTGSVHCSPDYEIHFGMNNLGLVNVYAEDVAILPEWQQQIWVGYSIGPDGGVSAELIASQVRAIPAETQAPEEYLRKGIEIANALAKEKLKISLFRDHELLSDLFEKTHRFRAIDETGLFALAKDVTRLIADSLDITAMQSIVPPPPKTNWGSLKSLENLMASQIEAEKARNIISALVGAYELRLADAHLPGKDVQEAFDLLNIDRSLPTVIQGYQLLHSCVSSLFGVINVLKNWNQGKN